MTEKRDTKQKRLIYETIVNLKDHPDADEIYRTLKNVGSKISLSTIYRNLDILCEEGKIAQVKGHRMKHYDHRLDSHEHIICRICGKVTDVCVPYDAKIDKRITEETGYSFARHHLLFEGICSNCLDSVRIDSNK